MQSSRKMPAQKPGKSEQTVETPSDFITAVEARFGKIDFDLAAVYSNAKASRFFGPTADSLKQDWTKLKGNLWLNPPFGDIAPGAQKCAESTAGLSALKTASRCILLLVPASVGSNWWAEHVDQKALVLFTSPRLKFVNHKTSYPKDLALVVYSAMRPGYECWRWNSPRRITK